VGAKLFSRAEGLAKEQGQKGGVVPARVTEARTSEEAVVNSKERKEFFVGPRNSACQSISRGKKGEEWGPRLDEKELSSRTWDGQRLDKRETFNNPKSSESKINKPCGVLSRRAGARGEANGSRRRFWETRKRKDLS